MKNNKDIVLEVLMPLCHKSKDLERKTQPACFDVCKTCDYFKSIDNIQKEDGFIHRIRCGYVLPK